MTNYEKIKSMSIDELAEFLVCYKQKGIREFYVQTIGEEVFKFFVKSFKQWLESETEPTYCTDKQNKLIHCEDCHEDC